MAEQMHQCESENCWCKREPIDFDPDEFTVEEINGILKANHALAERLKTMNAKLRKLLKKKNPEA